MNNNIDRLIDEKESSLQGLINLLDQYKQSHSEKLINPILFNFDIYCCPYNSSGSSYDFNKRISGARIYYKREENDNYY